MKIICIGRNYIDHIKELNNQVPVKPTVFLKPKNALVPPNKPLIHPQFTIDWEHEAEIVIKISKNGKFISESDASLYYNQFTLGLDMTARDLQNELKSKGLPWELAKAHDGSAAVGKFFDIDQTIDVNNIEFSLLKNNELVQAGNTKNMIFSIDHIIAFISNYFTLNMGDLIFTGTPAGVGFVNPGDILEGFIGTQKALKIKVN